MNLRDELVNLVEFKINVENDFLKLKENHAFVSPFYNSNGDVISRTPVEALTYILEKLIKRTGEKVIKFKQVDLKKVLFTIYQSEDEELIVAPRTFIKEGLKQKTIFNDENEFGVYGFSIVSEENMLKLSTENLLIMVNDNLNALDPRRVVEDSKLKIDRKIELYGALNTYIQSLNEFKEALTNIRVKEQLDLSDEERLDWEQSIEIAQEAVQEFAKKSSEAYKKSK